jgi:hypothetical protein
MCSFFFDWVSPCALPRQLFAGGSRTVVGQKVSYLHFQLSGRELNPGLPRDRRGYSPLYYQRRSVARLRFFVNYKFACLLTWSVACSLALLHCVPYHTHVYPQWPLRSALPSKWQGGWILRKTRCAVSMAQSATRTASAARKWIPYSSVGPEVV